MKRRIFIQLAGVAAVLGPPSGCKAARSFIFEGAAANGFDDPSLQKNDRLIFKVIGLGNCGSEAVDYMIANGVQGMEYICANPDVKALKRSQAPSKLHLGVGITQSFRAEKPYVGRYFALEARARIVDLIGGADMLFLTAGMGGGTGTGATPEIADMARELGIPTVAVVTMPFSFEGRRIRPAELGLLSLADSADYLIAVPNDRTLQLSNRNEIALNEAFRFAQEAIKGIIVGITESLTAQRRSPENLYDALITKSAIEQAMAGSGTATCAEKEIKFPLSSVAEIHSAQKGSS